MIIFLDLDGTLSNTADKKFKPYKDGKIDFEISNIPLFYRARDFVQNLKDKGHRVIILSDSHPKYVSKLAKEVFDVEYIFLADKPNVSRTLNFIKSDTLLNEQLLLNKDSFILIGDSSLDIELSRKLQIRSILLSKDDKVTGDFDVLDKIGSAYEIRKMGPTYCANFYEEIMTIIEDPMGALLSIEASFKDINTNVAVRFKDVTNENSFQIIRCLARQEQGLCDSYARADQYYQIDNPERTKYTLDKLAKGAQNYLEHVINNKNFEWDYFTYVPDKSTTTPPNKLKEIFDLIHIDIPRQQIFNWRTEVSGSLRQQPQYVDRKKYLENNLELSDEIDIKGKNIIILDDQLTTGATANYIIKLLKRRGAYNIIFVTLFQMILAIEDGKTCPKCGNLLDIKMNKKRGTKFYSCSPPKYNGSGCGYILNI